jgi:hypothetical protein
VVGGCLKVTGASALPLPNFYHFRVFTVLTKMPLLRLIVATPIPCEPAYRDAIIGSVL